MARPRRRYLPSNVVIQESPIKAGIESLTNLVYDLANKELERKSQEKMWEMRLLSDELGEKRREAKKSEEDLAEVKESYRDTFGGDISNDPEFTTTERENVATDVMGMYKNKIVDLAEEAKLTKEEIASKRRDLNIVERIKDGMALASPEYGVSPTEYGPADFEGDVLVPQFTSAKGKELKELVALFESYKKQNPAYFAEPAMDLLNVNKRILEQKGEGALYTAGQHRRTEELQERAEQVTILHSDLGNAPFVSAATTLGNQYVEESISDEELKEKTVNLFPTPGGRSAGSMIAPEYGKEGDKNNVYTDEERIQFQYEELVKVHNMFNSFTQASGHDYIGLARFTNKMKSQYKGLKGDEKKAFRKYLFDNFNYDVAISDKYIFKNFSKDLVPVPEDEVPEKIVAAKSYGVEDIIEATFSSKYSEITRENLEAFFYNSTNIGQIKDVYRQFDPKITDTQITDKIEILVNSIWNSR